MNKYFLSVRWRAGLFKRGRPRQNHYPKQKPADYPNFPNNCFPSVQGRADVNENIRLPWDDFTSGHLDRPTSLKNNDFLKVQVQCNYPKLGYRFTEIFKYESSRLSYLENLNIFYREMNIENS